MKQKKLLYKTMKSIYNYYNLKHKKELAFEHKQQLNRLNAVIYQMMCRISFELCECFYKRHYALLNTIYNIEDIRIYDYVQFPDATYGFRFLLSKTTTDKIANTLLLQARDNMNRDIFNTHNKYLSMVCIDEYQYMFPYLSSGLYVMSVQHFDESDVIITVASHMQP